MATIGKNVSRETSAKLDAMASQDLVRALALIVDMLPRGINKKTGKEYVGLRQDRCKLTELFFAHMLQHKHPLASTRNEDCSHEKPCNSCRRCVYESAINQAHEQGLIVRQPRGFNINDKGRMMRVSYIMVYRPGESATDEVGADFMERLEARLKS
jgi:hypothetical protein